MESEKSHILAGLTVVDFTQVLAGPTATRLMTEMGAEVIKVELPPYGDAARQLPYIRDGRSGYFIQQNRGKKSLCISVKHEAGRQLVSDLIQTADVVVENFSPGVIERMGFGYESVSRLKPDIIMCSISAFGRTGPLAALPGYDGVAQAYAGVLDLNGEPSSPPALLQVSPGDSATGVYATTAIVSALFHRERTGRGQYVEVSLLDSYLSMHEINIQAVSGSAGAVRPSRAGSHHYAVCPYGVFRAVNGHVVIAAVTDDQWMRLCEVIERSDLLSRIDLATNASRCEHQNAVIGAIESWTSTLEVSEAVRRLVDRRVPAAPVLSVEEAMVHPHHRGRRSVRTVEDKVWGRVDLPGVPMRFSEFPDELVLDTPTLGQDNRTILRSRLKLSDRKIDDLRAEGVLVDRPTDKQDRMSAPS